LNGKASFQVNQLMSMDQPDTTIEQERVRLVAVIPVGVAPRISQKLLIGLLLQRNQECEHRSRL